MTTAVCAIQVGQEKGVEFTSTSAQANRVRMELYVLITTRTTCASVLQVGREKRVKVILMNVS